MGGLWALTLPFVLWFTIKHRRIVLCAVYSLPILWFAVGYIAAM